MARTLQVHTTLVFTCPLLFRLVAYSYVVLYLNVSRIILHFSNDIVCLF